MASSAPLIDCDGGPVQLPGISQSGKELSEGVMSGRNFLTGISACLLLLSAAAAQAERASEIVAYADVRIEVIAEGSGPLVVLLPSRGRAAEDFDVVAAGIAKAGFRVLRPQPRGAGRSSGPMKGQSLHDFARDTAAIIRRENAGPAVLVGHAFGNWVARMTAVDHPQLVRGVAIVAAAAKAYPAGFDGAKALSEAVRKSGDPALSDAERMNYLRIAFFAPGSDASVWLQGWYPEVDQAQFAAGGVTKQSEWWPGGTVPLLDLQAALDPFKPRAMMNEIKQEFGERATIVVIPNASHALLPEQPAAVVEAIVAWMRGLPR
jgi:pimeloyl-ACP methyl ester carboxylesterase